MAGNMMFLVTTLLTFIIAHAVPIFTKPLSNPSGLVDSYGLPLGFNVDNGLDPSVAGGSFKPVARQVRYDTFQGGSNSDPNLGYSNANTDSALINGEYKSISNNNNNNGQYNIPSSVPSYVPTDTSQSLAQYFQGVQNQFANATSFAFTTPGATAYAFSRFGPSYLYTQQQEAFNDFHQKIASAVTNNGVGFAGATSSFSPQTGGYQSAYLSPPNPVIPNFSHFVPPSGQNGFYGVASGSFSASSDINGEKTNRRGGFTTINDNGKITTYDLGS